MPDKVPDTAHILVMRDVDFAYGGNAVFGNLSLDVQRGEFLGIIGPNGAGKSTLFNLIAGVVRADRGEILLDGTEISPLKVWARARQGIGRTYQIPNPFGAMTVFENVLVAATQGRTVALGEARAHAIAVLNQTGLAGKAETRADGLSLLDLKRLELARALGLAPRLLLLDEVAGGLTDAECAPLLDILRAVRRSGVTIVWIEHVIHALQSVADRIVVLHGGRFVASGPPSEVLADAEVRRIYLGA